MLTLSDSSEKCSLSTNSKKIMGNQDSGWGPSWSLITCGNLQAFAFKQLSSQVCHIVLTFSVKVGLPGSDHLVNSFTHEVWITSRVDDGQLMWSGMNSESG